MTTAEQTLSKTQVELLMRISGDLAQQTLTVEDFPAIPGYLARALQVPRVTVGIIQTVVDGAVVLQSATSMDAGPTLEQDLLDIHHQTPAAHEPVELHHGGQRLAILSHAIDDKHRMLLILHAQVNAPVDGDLQEILPLVARQLGRHLEILVLWSTGPDALGAPFSRLTDREWHVLRGLNSDAGEKQLADQLGLSPHTLHSHIKAIYRKVGVQGRLPLLRRVDIALREFRLKAN